MVDNKWCPHCGAKELRPIENPNPGTEMYVVSDYDGDADYFSEAHIHACNVCKLVTFTANWMYFPKEQDNGR